MTSTKLTRDPSLVKLTTERTVIRMPNPDEALNVLHFFERNRAHLERWEPTRPSEFYTETYWTERLTASQNEFREDCSCRCFIFRTDEVIGSINFNNIVRGAFQACHLGYSLDENEQGQGLMREALSACIAFAFGELHLHRLMANYQPINERSATLLKRLGFSVEGYARDYLFLNGAWRDHILTSLTNGIRQPG